MNGLIFIVGGGSHYLTNIDESRFCMQGSSIQNERTDPVTLTFDL